MSSKELKRTHRAAVCSSPEETVKLGRELARELSPPALVFLQGELGAGKTTLAKGIVAGLGAAEEDEVNSPTFVMVQEYGGGRVYHIDLYRVESQPDLESLGLDDLLAENAIVLVEWPERMALPDLRPSMVVRLEVTGETERDIRIERPAD